MSLMVYVVAILGKSVARNSRICGGGGQQIVFFNSYPKLKLY